MTGRLENKEREERDEVEWRSSVFTILTVALVRGAKMRDVVFILSLN
jgi:hypothetical protein